jgi:GTP1/Obg family GTP-binding protein
MYPSKTLGTVECCAMYITDLACVKLHIFGTVVLGYPNQEKLSLNSNA